MTRSLARILGVLAMTLAASHAHGQARDDRDARGLRMGAFMIHPSISLEQGVESNYFLAPVNRQSTYFAALAPRVQVRSDWNRHALRLDAGAKAIFFTNDSDDNVIDFDLTLAGQADITRKARITAEVAYTRDHDQRGTNDVPAASDRPVRFRDMNARLSGEVIFGNARFVPFAEWRRLNFDDTGLLGGGINNQDDRDRTELQTGLTLGVKVTRGYEGFLTAAYIRTDYVAPVDDTGVARDSTGYQVLGGFRIRLSRLLEGSVSAGVTQRRFDDPTLRDVTEVATEAGLIWKPTRRLTLTWDVARDLRETTLMGASALLATETAFGADYELLRTVTLKLNVSGSRLQFKGIPRVDTTFGTKLSAEWDLTRHFSLSPGYEFDMRRSKTAGLGYSAHRFFLDARYAF